MSCHSESFRAVVGGNGDIYERCETVVGGVGAWWMIWTAVGGVKQAVWARVIFCGRCGKVV